MLDCMAHPRYSAGLFFVDCVAPHLLMVSRATFVTVNSPNSPCAKRSSYVDTHPIFNGPPNEIGILTPLDVRSGSSFF